MVFPGDKLTIPGKERPKPQPRPVKHSVVAEEEIIERQFVKLNVR